MTMLMLAAALVGQITASAFAGTWTAAHNGHTFARLELREQNGVLTGRVSLGKVHLDTSGVVAGVLDPALDFTPIFDV